MGGVGAMVLLQFLQRQGLRHSSSILLLQFFCTLNEDRCFDYNALYSVLTKFLFFFFSLFTWLYYVSLKCCDKALHLYHAYLDTDFDNSLMIHWLMARIQNNRQEGRQSKKQMPSLKISKSRIQI